MRIDERHDDGRGRWGAGFRTVIVTAGLVAFGVAWAETAAAAGGRVDYDLDGDGLIEIDDLDDLDEII